MEADTEVVMEVDTEAAMVVDTEGEAEVVAEDGAVAVADGAQDPDREDQDQEGLDRDRCEGGPEALAFGVLVELQCCCEDPECRRHAIRAVTA